MIQSKLQSLPILIDEDHIISLKTNNQEIINRSLFLISTQGDRFNPKSAHLEATERTTTNSLFADDHYRVSAV